MNTPARYLTIAVLAFAGVTSASLPEAAAQAPLDDATRAAARDLGKEGLALYDAGKYEEALDKLTRADALVQLPTTGLYVARAMAKSNRMVEASEKYLAVTKMPLPDKDQDKHKKAQADAEKERGELLPRIPSIAVSLASELGGASVTLDGKPLPPALLGAKRPINPGKHILVAFSDGAKITEEVTIAPGESKAITLKKPVGAAAKPDPTSTGKATPPPSSAIESTPKPSASPASGTAPPNTPAGDGGDSGGMRGLQLGGWIGVGVGGVALIAGSAMGGVAMGKASDLEAKGCIDGVCPASASADLDSYLGLRTASTGVFWAGVGVAALGGTLLVVDAVTAPKAPVTGLSFRLHATGATVRGEF